MAGRLQGHARRLACAYHALFLLAACVNASQRAAGAGGVGGGAGTPSMGALDPGAIVRATFWNTSQGTSVNGMSQQVQPAGLPAATATLSYQVKLASDMRWGAGGTLPGLRGGGSPCGAAAAGVLCWTVQLAWRPDGQGQVVTDLPRAAQRADVAAGWSPSPFAAGSRPLAAIGAPFQWATYDWNDVRVSVGTSAGGRADGSLVVSVNGAVVATYSGVAYSKAARLPASGILLEVQYAGGAVPYDSNSDGPQSLLLTNVTLAQATDPWVDLTADQRRRAEQFTSIFENANVTLQYGYCQNLHDGMGFTFGYGGFTTATDDASAVVLSYVAKLPTNNTLQPFLANLTRLAKRGSSATSSLPGFCAAVSALAEDPAFQQAQQEVVQAMYWQPAMVWAAGAGLALGISKAHMYDAIINHGEGAQDPFSINHIFSGTAAAVGGTPATGVDEVTWLRAFFKVRTKMLLANGGEDAARRMSYYLALLDAGDLNMDGPITISGTPAPTGWTLTNTYYGEFVIL